MHYSMYLIKHIVYDNISISFMTTKGYKMKNRFMQSLEFRHACKIFDETKKIDTNDVNTILENTMLDKFSNFSPILDCFEDIFVRIFLIN